MTPADWDMLEQRFVTECMAEFHRLKMDTRDASTNRLISGIMAKAVVAAIKEYEALTVKEYQTADEIIHKALRA